MFGVTPVNFDDAFRIPRVQAEKVAAVLAMDADTAALRDVTGNMFRWHGTATPGKCGEQITNATDRGLISLRCL